MTVVVVANAAPFSLPTCFNQVEQLSDNLRFIALDVETAGYDISSICQIGLAFVGFDNSIEAFSAYIDPCTPFAAGNRRLHGIDAVTVKNAPRFVEVLSELRPVLEAYQSAFETGSEMRAGIGSWLNYYNAERPHSTHGLLPPNETYASKTEPMRLAA